MPLIATRGAASAQGFGEFAQTTAPVYIEDVFSTWLYTGNGSTQTITNGIDLSTKGGLVWVKTRNVSDSNYVTDTARGTGYYLATNTTGSQGGGGGSTTVSAFNTNGFSLGSAGGFNGSGETLVSWTFRKQPKFFDVVTFTGTANTSQYNHNLGSTPGCIIVKNTSNAQAWYVYHRSLSTPVDNYLLLNSTNAVGTISNLWGTVNSTQFGFSGNGGDNYVAYLFAHNAGGFGLTGSDNVISCGSFTHNGTSTSVNLGYEPQWMIIKRSDDVGAWELYDNMRGFGVGSVLAYLYPNYAFAETTNSRGGVTATGVTWDSGLSAGTYIYIAIRRGPMKTPTSGTSVFTPVASRSSGTSQATPIFNAGFPVDWLLTGIKSGGGVYSIPRLTVGQIGTFSTAAEASVSSTYNFGGMLGVLSNAGDLTNANVCGWNFLRAPGFFDVVCYTGNGSTPGAFNHNLGVVPEMVIVKSRSLGTQDWRVWAVTYSGGALSLNSTAAKTIGGFGGAGTIPATSSVFYVSPSSTPNNMNSSGDTYVAYLFATVAGVSKVGSYTGTGALQTVNCGFTTGARFVLIKRTDSTGDWWVYDSARGITSGNDPYLFLNSTAAEVTNTNYVDTTSVGFQVTAAAPAELNANGGNFIFLAVA